MLHLLRDVPISQLYTQGQEDTHTPEHASQQYSKNNFIVLSLKQPNS